MCTAEPAFIHSLVRSQCLTALVQSSHGYYPFLCAAHGWLRRAEHQLLGVTALTLAPGDALAKGIAVRGFLAYGSCDCFSPAAGRLPL